MKHFYSFLAGALIGALALGTAVVWIDNKHIYF